MFRAWVQGKHLFIYLFIYLYIFFTQCKCWCFKNRLVFDPLRTGVHWRVVRVCMAVYWTTE